MVDAGTVAGKNSTKVTIKVTTKVHGEGIELEIRESVNPMIQ
jgi:hypothetical protein